MNRCLIFDLSQCIFTLLALSVVSIGIFKEEEKKCDFDDDNGDEGDLCSVGLAFGPDG